MKVIVNVSGFYGGTWYEAGSSEASMPEKVAEAFLPPFGNQLSLPSADLPVAPASASRKAR